jgi:hypothetical protein
MSRVTYQVRNNYVESVRIEATYARPSQVPQIGSRRRMQVNGSKQLMTLNDLKVLRRGHWQTEKKRFDYVYDAIEDWGEFYLS